VTYNYRCIGCGGNMQYERPMAICEKCGSSNLKKLLFTEHRHRPPESEGDPRNAKNP